jgi:hypothetical protein
MFKPMSDVNVITKFNAETSASTSVSSRLPVILLRKSNHILYLLTVRNDYFGQVQNKLSDFLHRETQGDQDHHRQCKPVIDEEVQGMAVQEPEEKDDCDESTDKGRDESCHEYIEIQEGRGFHKLPPFKHGCT